MEKKEIPKKEIGEKEFANAMKYFDNIVGLDALKTNIQGIINNIKFQKLRDPEGQVSAGHYIFQGNPGTGKTTIARVMDDIFRELGILKGGHLVEVTREDFLAEHLGGTEKKTKDILNKSLGGILFIDEAYSLAGEGNDFGNNVIDIIVPFMENHRNDFILIAAGYKEDMRSFLHANTGLKSRFKYTLDFEDYSNEEMLEIFKIQMKQEDFFLELGVENLLKMIFEDIRNRSKYFGNAREARKLFEEMKTMLNTRLEPIYSTLKAGDERLFKLTFEDVPKKYHHLIPSDKTAANTQEVSEKIEKAFAQFDNIVGLDSVKKSIQEIVNQITIAKRRNSNKKISAGHYIFQGNPGTGKTTVARIMNDVFKTLGILESGQLIEVTKKDLVSGYIGQTGDKTANVLQNALGGILFIDEAYTLSQGGENDFGVDAIGEIVPFMENHRDDFILIVAGYKDEMKTFLDMNTGLKSRFTHTIDFEDYTADEMVQIFDIFLKQNNYKVESGVRNTLKIIFDMKKKNAQHFGNGRDARKLFKKICKNMDTRLVKDPSAIGDELYLIKQVDIMGIEL